MPVIMKMATLQELDNHWTFVDLIDFHDALNLKADIETAVVDSIKKDFKQ